MFKRRTSRRRLFSPEVMQTSAMDCGPASLKCLLEGHGIRASYGRLREACQIDVDGTSINTLEEVAVKLGLEAEQIMIPVEHVLLEEAKALPALVVIRLPNNNTHFVVAWRRVGSLLQVMDPGTGRLWVAGRQFLRGLYVHKMRVPAADWREWCGTEDFLRPLGRRLADLALPADVRRRLVAAALADASWLTMAALDAATRMVTSMAEAGGIRRGRQAARVLESFFERARAEGCGAAIPDSYWSVRPAPTDLSRQEHLMLSGAVLLRVRGRRKPARVAAKASAGGAAQDEKTGTASLSPELVAALNERPSRPSLELLRMLRADGLLVPASLLLALGLAACGAIIEIILFRVLFELGSRLGLVEQRVGAMTALLCFVAALLLLEWPTLSGLLRTGRHLEARLRVAFLSKVPRLGDQYFRSRLTSDMAERSHAIHLLRVLPDLGGRFLRVVFEIALTAAGIIWLDPASAWLVCLMTVAGVGLPLFSQSFMSHMDMRVRTHGGALSRFYLDSLLGLVAVRAHGAERAIRREHEGLLVEWSRAGTRLLRMVVAFDGIQSLIGFTLVAALLYSHLTRAGGAGAVLLLIYWALNIPVLGQEIAQLARQYPALRNVTLRLLEPLGAPEEVLVKEGADAVPESKHLADDSTGGVRLRLEDVSVHAGGHTILEEINLEIEAGSHVAIVGASGAGKTSLVGLLLGWHRPATGSVRVDDRVLNQQLLEEVRRETAWVDPAVQLWNDSLLGNLSYGVHEAGAPLNHVIEGADLRNVLEQLPEGLQTPLGEGGALLSGGEGQRVRLGRAVHRPRVRLVILDEPFRGLDREKRKSLLARARDNWRGATLLCVTHDVGETMAFGRVLVVEAGRIVEDGEPHALAAREGSRYGALLAAEKSVRAGMWSGSEWRRLRMEEGALVEEDWRERRLERRA
ncbi:MAG TPA: ATP-binding cassette domain-containing protein [Pyrinomonadaceae bacterium]|nr:ATP-binding cassette domain-containing protein [Pyrinomonadaceae bacterium]